MYRHVRDEKSTDRLILIVYLRQRQPGKTNPERVHLPGNSTLKAAQDIAEDSFGESLNNKRFMIIR